VIDEIGLEDIRGHVLNVLGTTRTSAGDDGGTADLTAAVQLGSRTHDYQTVNSALNNLAEAHRQAGRWADEAEAMERMRDGITRYGTSHEFHWLEGTEAAVFYTAGGWEGALREAGKVITDAEGGISTYLESVARVVRALIWLARDDVTGADQESEAAVRAAEKAQDVQVVGPALATRARVALAAGRRDEAAGVAARVSRLDPSAALLTEAQVFVDFMLLLDELRMDEEMTRVLDSLPAWWPMTRAGGEIAARRFASAADILTCSRHPLWEALLRMRAAETLGHAGLSADAEDQLKRSLEFFRSVGATRYVRQGEELRAGTRDPGL
jgi:hypothetical protein